MMLDQEERKREWYAWEKRRNRERTIRGCAGCLLLLILGLIAWWVVFVLIDAVERWLAL